jgi:hypothetical protein
VPLSVESLRGRLEIQLPTYISPHTRSSRRFLLPFPPALTFSPYSATLIHHPIIYGLEVKEHGLAEAMVLPHWCVPLLNIEFAKVQVGCSNSSRIIVKESLARRGTRCIIMS